MLNMNALSNQLGIGSLPQLEGFRTSLAKKCRLKRKQALPNVLLTSQNSKEQNDTMETDDSSFYLHPNLEEVEVDPVAPVEAAHDNQALDLESENVSSVGRQTGEEAPIIGGIPPPPIPAGSIVIRFEQFQPGSTAAQGVREVGVIPVAKCVETYIDGDFYYGRQCPKCPKILKDQSLFETHYRWYHLTYKCNVCDKILSNKQAAKLHYDSNHLNVGTHPCKHCSRVYKTPFKLRKHNLVVHKNTLLACPQCDASFTRKVNLRQHIRALHEPGKFTCPHCPTPTEFTTNKYLRYHIKKHHREFYVAGQPSQPNNLSSTTRQNDDKSEVKAIGTIQVGNVNWKVTLPNVRLASRLGEAQTSGTLNGESSIQDNSFILPQDLPLPISLGRENNEGGAIGRAPIGTVNRNDDDDDEIVELPTSDLSEAGVIPVGVEAVTCLQGILYNGRRCPNCSKEFRNEKEYERHFRWYHLGFRCNTCGNTYKNQAIARGHFKRVHQKTVATVENKGSGGNITSGERHGCIFCGKVFDAEYKLKSHVRQAHTKKRIPCPHCEADFNLKYNLEQHIIAVHQPGNFPCPHCTESSAMGFGTNEDLRAHIRTQHPENC
ncbi:unnamed protein product [Orchesella dallaii]|uniref:C2H2-type domain-containing protein n=1 Tax=Orchesella dallaii TaxID=48710 RepID=A0ABP1SAY4_9HEXA